MNVRALDSLTIGLRPLRRAALAGALTLLATAPALAGGARPEFPISLAEAGERAEARFAALDTDGNGEISPAELEAAPRDAWGAFHHRPGGHRGADAIRERDRETLDAAMFDELDSDGDGMLSREEFSPQRLREARRSTVRSRMFEHLDADASGGLSREELPGMIRHLQAMDSDGDGSVSREEARAYRAQRGRDQG